MEGDTGYESYLKIIIDSLPAGIVFVDGGGHILYRNKKAGDMGIDKANILENPVIKKSGYLREIKSLLKDKTSFSTTWKRNGRFFSVDGIPADGGGILTINDVSERVYVEKALKEKEEKYRILTESSPAGILMIKDGKCTFSNKKFGDITGYGMNVLKKDFFSDMLHTGDVGIVRKKMKEAMDGKNPASCTVRLIRKDGGTAWVELDVCVVDYNNEKELLVNVVDITEKRKMEDNIKISNKRMEEIMERERRFVEDISHYFFNPLCIAKGYIDLSIKEADPEMMRRLEITKSAVNRVETVVKHIVTERKIYE